MSATAVEAVFFWRYTKAPFAATYGRLSGSEYSKDFLQSPADQYPLIDKALGWSAGQIEFEYRWPGGSREGYWRHSAADNRGQLAWPTSNAPTPWRVGDPARNAAISLPGDPDQRSETGANAVFDALQARGWKPFLLAVKLRGEGRALHVRTYFEHPPEDFAERGIDHLPSSIRKAMLAVPERGGGGALYLDGRPNLRAPALTSKVLESLQRDPNVLLIGPPGTGKTVVLEDLKSLFGSNGAAIGFDPEKWYENWSELTVSGNERRVISLVFHPSYTYEDFIAGLIPSTSSGGGIHLTARAGPLLSLAHWASGSSDRRGLLLIDEFNRGPAAAIFGDALALLDGSKRDGSKPGASIQRPFPKDKMEVDPEFARADGEVAIDREVKLPETVWVVGALNSTDRSVAPLDAALRRRFSIIQVPPDYEALSTRLGISTPNFDAPFTAADVDATRWSPEQVAELAVRVLHALNRRIEFVSGNDFALGHALLWDAHGTDLDEATRNLAQAFDRKVTATLRLTYLEQDDALSSLLKVSGSSTAESAVAFWMDAPQEVTAVAARKLVIQDIAELPGVTALRALQRLL